jgi:CheY-like chemotaxis protein
MSRGREPQAAAGAIEVVAPRGSVVVLAVDDEPVVRAVVGRALDRFGVPAMVVASGREALRIVADDILRPTVLLTDIDMPEMTGIELAARIAALRPSMRIVMMTGDPHQAAAARAHSELVSTVLVKPVTLAELREAIETPGDQVERP